jgi:hypothetical protein
MENRTLADVIDDLMRPTLADLVAEAQTKKTDKNKQFHILWL